MLDFTLMRNRASTARKTAATTVVSAEGAALVADLSVDNGVALSAGVAGEQFVGISINSQLTPNSLPDYEELSSGTGAAFTTLNAPLAGTLFVYDKTSGTLLTAAAVGTAQGSLTANQYAQAATGSKSFVVPAARASHTILVGYRYSPSVAAVQWMQGDALPGQNVASTLDTIGVITAGDVYTSEYDTSGDWTTAALYVKLGANGLFVATAVAAENIPGVRVIARPSATQSFLGLSLGNNG